MIQPRVAILRIGIPPRASTGPGEEAGISGVGVRPRWECSGEPQVRICEGWRDVKEVEEARNVVGGEGRGWVDCGVGEGEGEVRREEKEGKVCRRVVGFG